MNPKIELMDGAITGNLYLLGIDIFLIVQYFYSWFQTSYKKGYKIDFWHFSLFIPVILSCLIMYPFAGSVLNGLTIGINRMDTVKDFVDFTFILGLIVYTFINIGSFVAKKNFGKKTIYYVIDNVNLFGARLIQDVVSNKIAILILTFILFFTTTILIVYSYLSFGFAFNYRDIFLADTLLTTLFNIWNSTFVGIFSLIIARMLVKKSYFLILVSLLLVLMSILTGSRLTFFLTFINTFIFYLIGLQENLKFRKYVLLAVPFILLFVLVGNLRAETEIEGSNEYMFFSFFYGNNFSDLRDSAWVLSYWDGVNLWGKTYLAAFLGFIPSSMIEFRTQFNLASYTNNLVGLDNRTHAGLRPIVGIEPFLNFGLLGLIINAFIIGYVNRYVDLKIKERLAVKPKDYVGIFSFSFLNIIIVRFYNTGGFWLLYVFLFYLILGKIIQIITKNAKNWY